MTYPLPSGWQEVKLQECLLEQPKYGMNAPAVKYDNSLPTYIRITDIDEYGNFINDNKVSVNNENYEEYILNDNDFLFARTGASVGKTYLYNKKDGILVFAGYLIKVKPNQNILNSLFLKYYTQSKRYWDFVKITSTRTGQPGINGKEYANMNIILPPLEEQKRIAEVLSLCDDIIENLTKLIEKKEQYKKGVMQRLLSAEVRFKGFTDEWQKYKLLDIGISYSGLTNKNASNFIDNCNAKYVTYKSIYDSNKIDINRLEDVFVEKDEKQNLVQYGDAFFTISSETPDEVAISSVLLDKVDNTYLNSFCFGFRFDFNILLPEFARYYFRSTYKLSQGSTRFNLSKNKFLEMIINIPSIEEQKKIAGLLSVIDEEIENLKKQLELRKQQKKGLMQRLLTGEVRI